MSKACYILLLSCCLIQAQDSNKSSIDELIETYLEDATIAEGNQQIYDLLEQLSDEPIDLNNATAEELQKIPFIDFDTASKIIDYRNKYGRYFSVNALNMIGDIPSKTIGIIKKFVYVEKTHDKDFPIPGMPKLASSDRKIHISLRSRFLTDLQERRGYRENLYAGSILKTYNRLQIEFDKFRFGLLAEKDAGENSYYDFLSYHLEAKNLGIIDRMVIGDYQVEFGQGLSVWSPYSLSKGSDATGPVTRSSRRIISYTSADENLFFRGAAANVSISNFKLSAFYSYKKIDASVEKDMGEINSILYSGLHRTRSELNNKETVSQRVMGATLSAQLFSNTGISLLYIKSDFDMFFRADNFRDPKGRKFESYSVSYHTKFENIFFSGETSSDGKNFAWINTLQYSIGKTIAFSASVRSFDKSYISIYSNGFGESSNTQNEYGYYIGFRLYSKSGLLNIYFDQFKFPSSTLRNPLPGSGNEMLIDYTTKLFSTTEFNMRYKMETKELAIESDGFKRQIERTRQNLRVDIKMNVSSHIRFRTRFEYSSILDPASEESGLLTFQDIQFRPYKSIVVYGRIIFFNTDSYNSRIYEFENDLRGVMNNLPMYGNGIRWYLMLRISLSNFFTLAIKYSELYKPGIRTLGNGNSQIMGSLDNRFGLQIDFNY